MPTRLIIVSF